MPIQRGKERKGKWVSQGPNEEEEEEEKPKTTRRLGPSLLVCLGQLL